MPSPKRLLFLLLAISSFCLSVLSGQSSSLHGRISTEDGHPLAFANVLLLSPADSSLVAGNITAEDGSYEVNGVAPGTYLLAITMVGYKALYVPDVLLGISDKALENLVLEEDIAQLESVEVVARKPLFEQKMDRMTVNVQNSVTSAGSSVLDVLQRSPGVAVDRQGGRITMAGKEDVVVMINGKITRMPPDAVAQMLAGMNAGNVEQIELITTPPANLDAEGNAGFINIVLKENTLEGFNGNLSLNTGYGRGEKFGGSLNFNYRKNKINLYGDYAFLWDHNPQVFANTRRLDYEGSLQETLARSDRDPVQRNHNARLGLDLDISDKTVLGFLLSGYDSKWDMVAFNEVTYLENGNLTQALQIRNEEINQWRHYMANINLQHTFSEGQVLSLDADYLYYFDDNPHTYLNQHFTPTGELEQVEELRISKETPLEFGVGKIDYSRKLGDNVQFSAGLKGTLSFFNNKVLVEELQQGNWIADPQFTQNYGLEESIGAAYSILNLKLGENTKLNLGLRYEYTDSYLSSEEEGGIVDREYGYFFPNLAFSQEFGENNGLQLSYNRRITRPTFNDLAPFVIFIDPNTYFSGNAALQPSLSNTFKAGYRFKQYLLSLEYTLEDEAIARFQNFIDPEANQQTIAATNLDSRHTATLQLAIPAYVTDWWEMQNSFTGVWQRIENDFDGTVQELAQTYFLISSSQTFQLPWDLSLELSGFFQSKSFFGVSDFEPLGMLNAGLQKKLPDGQGNLNLTISDIFWTGGWRFTTYAPERFLDVEGKFLFEPRVIRLTYSRSFGNSKLKGSRQRETGSEMERGRVN